LWEAVQAAPDFGVEDIKFRATEAVAVVHVEVPTSYRKPFGDALIREEGAPLVIDPGMLPRKPARQRKPRAPREAIE